MRLSLLVLIFLASCGRENAVVPVIPVPMPTLVTQTDGNVFLTDGTYALCGHNVVVSNEIVVSDGTQIHSGSIVTDHVDCRINVYLK